MEVIFSPKAQADLAYWKQIGNKRIQAKIGALIDDVALNLFKGLGKPELLKFDLTGRWSRRINREHRMIYVVEDGDVIITSLRGHYK